MGDVKEKSTFEDSFTDKFCISVMDSFDPTVIGLPDDRMRKPQPSPTDGLPPEVQRKIVDAFETFDHEHNKTVDAREIGTIIRSLGFCPSEAELQEVTRDME